MNVSKLDPAPARHETFRRNRERFISEGAGCYALTNFSQEVMYVGRAKNLRRRFIQHLDSPDKTAVTSLGKAMIFWWLETAEINKLEKLERTWMNIHSLHEGARPTLNRVDSPMLI